MTSNNRDFWENGLRYLKSEFSILKAIDVPCRTRIQTFKVLDGSSAMWRQSRKSFCLLATKVFYILTSRSQGLENIQFANGWWKPYVDTFGRW